MTRLNLLNWLGHVLLGLGLCGPCMTVTPRLEPVQGLAEWLGLVGEPKTYSIVTGVRALLGGGNVWIGLVLLIFSVLFPLAKVVALRICIADARRGRGHALAARFGRYSMVDVFVIALLVVAGKSYPGGTTVEIEWGIFAFGAAALLAMIISTRLPVPPNSPA
ncbi:MAG: paraquat-inducible protein A [Planctomycetota bacterium]|jgi:paraquat-inducible protein A